MLLSVTQVTRTYEIVNALRVLYRDESVCKFWTKVL